MSSASGPDADTAAGDIVQLLISNPDTPLGVTFEADIDGKAAVIKSFDRLPNGKFGPFQKHGGIHQGDVLISLNEIVLESIPHTDVLSMMKDRNILKKSLKFMNSKEYYRKRRAAATVSTTESNKNNFLSTIRRYRVNQDEYNRKYVEYEIGCQLRLPASRVQKDIVHKWSLWKRYSQFDQLNTQLRASLGWQMDGIEFPSSYTFSFNKMSPDFIEQRKDDLSRYWQQILAIEKITEFTKHHCSQELKLFLDIEDVLSGNKVSIGDPTEKDEVKETDDRSNNTSSNPNRRSQRVTSMRRRAGVTSVNLSAPSTPTQPSEFSFESSSSIDASKSLSTTPIHKTPPPPSANVMTTDNLKPVSAPSPQITAPTAASAANPSKPPQPTGARANLLSQISAMRKD